MYECEMLPDYRKLSAAFGIWKRRFQQINQSTRTRLYIRQQSTDPASILREIQTISTSIVIGEKRRIRPTPKEHSTVIRHLTEKHDLLRKIEIQKDLNAALRQRFDQMSREVSVKQQVRPIPQSPAFRKIPRPSQNDEALLSTIQFPTRSRNAYQPSKNQQQNRKIGASGRITHMDILKLQFG